MENKEIKYGKGIMAYIEEQRKLEDEDRKWLNSLSKEEYEREINRRIDKALREDAERRAKGPVFYMGIDMYNKLKDDDLLKYFC